MKLLNIFGSVVLGLALTVSAAEGAGRMAGLEGASKGMPPATIESSGEVTILRAVDQYMGLSDYTLGVPAQTDKSGITAEVKGIPVEKKDYTYRGLEAYEEGVPSQSEMVVNHEESALYYRGTLESVNTADNLVMVRLAVPGLKGISFWDVPFDITSDTTMTICTRSLPSCESTGNAISELGTLAGLQTRSDFNAATKDVVIVNNPDTGEVVHIEVNYNL